MKKRSKKMLYVVCGILAASLLLVLICKLFIIPSVSPEQNSPASTNSSETPASQKKTVTGYASWPLYTFESAINESATIVWGKVLGKGDTVINEQTDSLGQTFNEYFREVTIEIIDCAKGDIQAGEMIYLEPGGETEDTIYIMDGAPLVTPGQEYIFFLNEHDVFMSPTTLIPVINGNAQTSGLIAPNIPTGQSISSDSMSAQQYMEEVRALID